MKDQGVAAKVWAQYFPADTPVFEYLSGGMVNASYKVTSEKGVFILQKLSPIFSGEGLECDFDTVTKYLKKNGWDVPTLAANKNGKFSTKTGNGDTWRVMTFIESDGKIPKNVNSEAGKLLGKLHSTLAGLDYKPKFALPHFHETSYYARQLREKLSKLDENNQEFGQKALKTYDNAAPLETGKIQLIHGDPRTANMLFRGGKPFTFIDFDTIMVGSIWLDVGDLLRSLAEDAMNNGQTFNLAQVYEVADAYRTAACHEEDETLFRQSAVKAMQRISLELTMRFLIDVVDDNYFDWDNKQYKSRKQHNTERAKQQWAIHRFVYNEGN